MNRYERRKQWFNIVKFRIGCQVCEERHPSVLTWVPVDPERRAFAPGRRITNNMERLLQEMEGSLLLCLNCARKAQDGIIDLGEYQPPQVRLAAQVAAETVAQMEGRQSQLGSGSVPELPG